MSRKDRDYKRTLGWINKNRQHVGAPTLGEVACGIRGSRSTCAVANSLGEGSIVMLNLATMRDPTLGGNQRQYRSMKLPSYVKRFIERFDNGEYPQLDAEIMSIVSWAMAEEEVEVVQ